MTKNYFEPSAAFCLYAPVQGVEKLTGQTPKL